MQDAIEHFFITNTDAKGRTFGYVAGIREETEGGKCYAWVQRSIRNKDYSFSDFGVPQRSKLFGSLAEAKRWAMGEVKTRAESNGLKLIGCK